MPSIGSFICNFSSPEIAPWPEVQAPHAEGVMAMWMQHCWDAPACAVPGTLKEGDLEQLQGCFKSLPEDKTTAIEGNTKQQIQ